MRDKHTASGRFRGHLKRLTQGLFYEAMDKLAVPISTVKYVTPIGEEGEGSYIDSSNYALIAIMRTGMGMAGAVQDTLEEAVIGHAYYMKDPEKGVYQEVAVRIPNLDNKFVFIFDSAMLSGGTVLETLRYIVEDRDVHPSRIAVLTCIASVASIEAINAAFDITENPIPIFTAAIDTWNEGEDYSRPGAGSFRERLYGWRDEEARA